METLLSSYPEKLKGFKRGILAEYLQCLILSYVFPLKKGDLRFIGGTAVRLGWGSGRFSEDIDFDGKGVSRPEFEDIAGRVVKKLRLEGYDAEADLSFKGASRCFIRFPGIYHAYGLSARENEKLLIQLDYEPQEYSYKAVEKVINRFGIFTAVPSAPVDVLLSMKISALLGRKRPKGRDFYDVTYLFSFTQPDFKFLKLKNGIKDMDNLKEKLLQKADSLDMKAVAADVAPFLFAKEDVERVLNFRLFVEQLRRP